MQKFFLLLLLIPYSLAAQERKITFQLIDPIEGHPIAGARVCILDTFGTELKKDYSGKTGICTMNLSVRYFTLQIDSIPERCDGGNLNLKRKAALDTMPDTLKLVLSHYWADYEIWDICFQEGGTTFYAHRDSASVCSFNSTDSTCITTLLSFGILHYYDCGPFSKMQLTSYYTSKEDSMYGDSMAVERARLLADYFRAHGMQNVEFVVRPMLYALRPLRNYDGSFRKEEATLIRFGILEW